jgi:beta-lactam-binding protein with PASTA domain
VPIVRGSTLARARRAIALRHCRTGAVRYAFSRAAQRGRVVAQTPRAGRVVARGTRVVLTVGRGLKR